MPSTSTTTTTTSSGTAPPVNDDLLHDFARYVRNHDIFISPLIAPHRFPGRGLGVRATGPLPPKTRLMHVPTPALLKWSDVPDAFLPASPPPTGADGVRVHARLAAYLALADAHEVQERYGPWMATWPAGRELEMGVVGMWPGACRDVWRSRGADGQNGELANGVKKRKISRAEDGGRGFAVLPPGITGRWATLDGKPRPSEGREADGILAPQQRKFEGDVAAAARFFPALADRSSAEYKRFVWRWYCVNTRCFYYWPTWKVLADGKLRDPPAAPEDRDEAMAMCPAMDFFNHTVDENSGLCCSVDYDRDGFTVLSPDKWVRVGAELFISYGAHGEEDLWVEYGFMLGGESNRWDGINIDAIVLGDARMTDEKREILREAGYEGEYTLRRDGVCWRTETAARLLIMGQEEWESFVEGTYADDCDEKKEEDIKDAVDEVVREWVNKVQREAENSIHGLEELTKAEAVDLFCEDNDNEDQEDSVKLAQVKLRTCEDRWRQIWKTCKGALEATKDTEIPC